MWIPNSEEEVINVVTLHSIEEGPTFDAKRSIPANHKTAKTLAAMANDGGVIIYGIGEDEDGIPRKLSPIELHGAAERITAIARTAVDEPIHIETHEIRTKEEPSQGYLVVVVPPSERAPHMVTGGGIDHYYGRKGKQNIHLTEGEVGRLYERRRRVKIDLETLLDKEIDSGPFDLHPDYGYLYLFAHPTFGTDELLNRAIGEGETEHEVLHALLRKAHDGSILPQNRRIANFGRVERWVRRFRGYMGSFAWPADAIRDIPSPDRAEILQVDFDGSTHFFCGRAAVQETIWNEKQLALLPLIVASYTAQFVALTGELYRRARYYGPVGMGVAVTGINGAIPFVDHMDYRVRQPPPINSDKYRKILQRPASTLVNAPIGVAHDLLVDFFETIFQGLYHPFKVLGLR